MLTKKNAKAFAVLAILHELVGQDELQVEPFLNKNQNGFKVSLNHSIKQVVFSKAPHTDKIQAYYGTSIDFSDEGNVPLSNDTDYVLFDYDQHYEAAVWINNYIRTT